MEPGYVTLDEANEIVASMFESVDPVRVNWSLKADEDKQSLLNSAFLRIESLPYVGRKVNPDQEMEFPRVVCSSFRASDDGSMSVPYKVKVAQVMEALYGGSATKEGLDAKKYAMMASRNISSYRIGNLQESFGSRTAGASSMFDNYLNMVSYEAIMYLGDWLQGGYDIC